MKRILVACEESQSVTKEFRKLGFEAYSCDLRYFRQESQRVLTVGVCQ